MMVHLKFYVDACLCATCESCVSPVKVVCEKRDLADMKRRLILESTLNIGALWTFYKASKSQHKSRQFKFLLAKWTYVYHISKFT